MDLFNLQFKNSFEKDLRSLPKHIIEKTLVETNLLTLNPFPNKAIKLKGSDNLFRIRIGDYRLVYQVSLNPNLILVYYIRHRREVYRAI